MKILKGFIWFAILWVTLVTCGLLYLRSCDWDPVKASEYVTKNAENITQVGVMSIGIYLLM